MYVCSGVRTLSRAKSVAEKNSIFESVTRRLRDGAADGEESVMGAEAVKSVFVLGWKIPVL